MNKLVRILRHLWTTRWYAQRRFTPAVLQSIENAIRDTELRHRGELRFVIETALDLPQLLQGVSGRQRATEVFSQLGVWDTAENTGVLIYVLLADRDVEVLADRGIAAQVSAAQWTQVCHDIEQHYRAGRFVEGSVAAVHDAGALLARHFPATAGDANELSNQPVLL
jgi:uncharacterized membrane protein